MLHNFTLIQKIRNKLKIDSTTQLFIANDSKIVQCVISIFGKNNRLTIESGVNIRKSQIEIIGDNCEIFIGQDTSIGHNSYLSAKYGTKLIIKEDCMFSRNATIMTSDGHDIIATSNNSIINRAKDIIIQKHVWLADNVTVLKGVTIGENSVVGINATVTKSVPNSVIAVGNPAKVVKKNIYWKR